MLNINAALLCITEKKYGWMFLQALFFEGKCGQFLNGGGGSSDNTVQSNLVLDKDFRKEAGGGEHFDVRRSPPTPQSNG